MNGERMSTFSAYAFREQEGDQCTHLILMSPPVATCHYH